MFTLRVFTRKPTVKNYPAALGNSVHFAVCSDGKETVLNQDYGILFAKAKIKEDNTLDERGIRNPLVVKKDDGYVIYAEVIDKEGQPVASGEESIIAWSTKDFVNFEECSADAVGPEASESIELPDELFPAVSERWIPLEVKSVSVPEDVRVDSLKELKDIRVRVIYSDGSEDLKPVYWSIASLRDMGNRRYRITGHMQAIDTGFPLTVGLADPVIFLYEGKWYYIATNDNVNDIGLYVRCADTVDGLFTDDVETKIILDYDEERGLCQTFWAPEFHVIGGRLYILFAVSNKNWGPQCHMMRLKKGGNIMCAEDWEDPIRVKRMNDHFLTEDGITLDMTYFESAGKAYLAWSYRYGIGTPKDTGSMLYIATTDPEKPWVLTSEPVLLSRPLYGWENQSGTINNEGPYALISGDTVYLSYSGGDACGPAYVVGYLKVKVGADLLDISSWKKEPTAVLHLQSVEGILGPGHNSFFYDMDGRLMIAYHAQERDKYNCRCSAFHRVHLSASGFPLLNVVGERDLPAEMSDVEMEFTIG